MSSKRRWDDIKDRFAGTGNNTRMGEPSSTTFDYRVGKPVLIDRNAPPLTYAQEYHAKGDAAKLGLKASEAVEVLSIPVRFRDMRHKGKLRETFIKCSLLRRIIEQPGRGPRRDGIGHDAYSYAMAYLVNEGIAQCDPSGRNGYTWTDDHKHIHARASWLLERAAGVGELRRVRATIRYAVEG